MKTLVAISSIIIVSFLMGCGQTLVETQDEQTVAETTTIGEKPAGNEHQIIIDNSSFAPAEIIVKIGDTVTWINKGKESYTVTSWYKQEDEDFALHVFIGETWDSGDIEPGESYSRVFDSLGKYDYLSLPLFHYEYFDIGPIGVVVVE